jgi:hypothetical protein
MEFGPGLGIFMNIMYSTKMGKGRVIVADDLLDGTGLESDKCTYCRSGRVNSQ